MERRIQSILAIGLGKVGRLVATRLHQAGYRVTGLDAGSAKQGAFSVIRASVTQKKILNRALKEHDAVVTCLPYHLNLSVAQAAHRAGKHYFDLTEDVATTQATVKLAKSAKGVMAPQCGLAPGFLGTVGAELAYPFSQLRTRQRASGA